MNVRYWRCDCCGTDHPEEGVFTTVKLTLRYPTGGNDPGDGTPEWGSKDLCPSCSQKVLELVWRSKPKSPVPAEKDIQAEIRQHIQDLSEALEKKRRLT